MPAVVSQLVAIPAGTLELRDARSDSTREVALEPFEIGRTEVTWAEFARAAAAPAPPRSGTDDARASGEVPLHPVTWFDAVQWCNAASALDGLAPAYAIDGREVAWVVAAEGYRLPTEAEWEWVCRAGSPSATYGPLSEIAWTSADGVAGPQPVARKAPNAFGVHHMLGNVWEWCWDYADTARYGDYRSLRGGGWADREWSVRASGRRGSAPDAVLEDVGFRIARGAVGDGRADAAQGWSAAADRRRADVRGPIPMGWTPLR